MISDIKFYGKTATFIYKGKPQVVSSDDDDVIDVYRGKYHKYLRGGENCLEPVAIINYSKKCITLSFFTADYKKKKNIVYRPEVKKRNLPNWF